MVHTESMPQTCGMTVVTGGEGNTMGWTDYYRRRDAIDRRRRTPGNPGAPLPMHEEPVQAVFADRESLAGTAVQVVAGPDGPRAAALVDADHDIDQVEAVGSMATRPATRACARPVDGTRRSARSSPALGRARMVAFAPVWPNRRTATIPPIGAPASSEARASRSTAENTKWASRAGRA